MQFKPIPATLPGTAHAQYVRCGNRNCKCYRGQLHGPYWYRFWRDARGRAHKRYVQTADLDVVRAACAARQDDEREVRAILAQGAQAVRWYLRGGAERLATTVDLDQMLALPWAVGKLLDLACAGERPAFATRGFAIITPLWLHFRAEQLAQENHRANMRRLLGDRYQEDTEAAGTAGRSGPTMHALMDSYSGTTTLQ